MASEQFVNLGNARHDDQRQVMEGIASRGECPFCPDHLHKTHHQPILRQGEHWLLTPNQWPYDNTRLHLLAIAMRHVTTLSELGANAGDELFDHFAWAERKYAIAAGGVAMRFGDVTKNGATVDHLHSHLIVPEDGLPADVKVRFKIG